MEGVMEGLERDDKLKNLLRKQRMNGIEESNYVVRVKWVRYDVALISAKDEEEAMDKAINEGNWDVGEMEPENISAEYSGDGEVDVDDPEQ